MNFEIVNKERSPVLNCKLNKHDSVLAEAGSMFYLNSKVEFETNNITEIDTLQEQIANEGVIEKTLFKSNEDGGELSLAPKSIASDILHLDLNNETIYCDGLSYLASGTNFDFKIQGTMKSVMTGHGLFLQRIEGSGNVFLESYGSVIVKELKADESLIVDYGHLIAFQGSVEYKLLKPKQGTVNSTSIGEWIVTRFRGPGKIWLQSRNRSENASVIKSYI